MPISENAKAVLERRYLARDEQGQPTETVDGLFRRVANAVAEGDRRFDSKADVVATATGGKNVVNRQALDRAKAGVFILNVGHVAEEIDGEYLRQYPQEEVMPYINAYRMADKTLYLLANGSMLNLTAGFGDSLNAFDVTLAVMARGIRHIVTDGMRAPAKVYLLPQAVWQQAL